MAYNVTTTATKAAYSTAGADWSANQTLDAADTLTINGTAVALAANDTRTSVVSKVNAYSGTTGVTVSAASNSLEFSATGYGTDYSITMSWGASGTMGDDVDPATTATAGVNVAGTIGGSTATGNGLTLTATGTEWNDSAITFLTDASTGANNTDIAVTEGGLKFNIGSNASADEIVSFSINDMSSTNLGSATNGYLDNSTNGIKTGQGNALATNAAGAVAIIDDAISDVSNERSKLGAYQKNAIESMQNNLGATLENIQAAESRIRDLDMAKEMMNFTKNQILIQAGTAMLAQANMIPQSALQLIG